MAGSEILLVRRGEDFSGSQCPVGENLSSSLPVWSLVDGRWLKSHFAPVLVALLLLRYAILLT